MHVIRQARHKLKGHDRERPQRIQRQVTARKQSEPQRRNRHTQYRAQSIDGPHQPGAHPKIEAHVRNNMPQRVYQNELPHRVEQYVAPVASQIATHQKREECHHIREYHKQNAYCVPHGCQRMPEGNLTRATLRDAVRTLNAA